MDRVICIEEESEPGRSHCSVEARAGVALVSNIPAPPLSLIICALYLGNSVIPIEGVIAPPRIRLISRPDNLVPEYPQTQLQYLEATCHPGQAGEMMLGVTA